MSPLYVEFNVYSVVCSDSIDIENIIIEYNSNRLPFNFSQILVV